MNRNGIVVFSIILSSFLFGCTSVQSKAFDNVYQKVLDAPNKDKNTVYRISNEWFVENFVSAKSVIQYQDKEEGIIKGKGNMTKLYSHNFDFVVTIDTKDSKARITFTDMHWGTTGNSLSDALMYWDYSAYTKFCKVIDPYIQDLALKLQAVDDSSW